MRKGSCKRARSALDLATRTNAFSGPELIVLEEVLGDCLSNPDLDYRIEEIHKEGALAGFLIWGRTPMTQKGYDIYWIAVDPAFQGKGFGKDLMARVEDTASAESGGCILRLETSGRSEYDHQRRFYHGCGFSEVGRIKDFYRYGDDLVTYVKFVTRDLKDQVRKQ